MSEYYVENVARLPFETIFRHFWWNPLIILFLAFKKIFKTRGKPIHAARRPGELDIIEREEIPRDALVELLGLMNDAFAAGMELCFCVRSNHYIGGKEIYAVYFRTKEGAVFGTAIWYRLRNEFVSRSEAKFSLHSRMTDGAIIHTAATRPVPMLDSLALPPNHEMHYMPEGTKVQELLKAHESNLAAHGAKPHSHDCEELKTVALHMSQSAFDQSVRSGLLTPATEKEIERLKTLRNPK